MNSSLEQKLTERYKQAGFEIVESNDKMMLFKNKFSVHCLFAASNIQEVSAHFDKYDNLFKKPYFSSNYPEDFYWNFYCIYIVDDHLDTQEKRKIRDNIENNTQLARRFVIEQDKIDLLPPLHLTIIKSQTDEHDELWEKQWSNAIGKEMYDKLVSSPKSNIDDILLESLNDK